MRIEHLNFTVRIYNTLIKNGIRTFSRLKSLSEKDLIEMKTLPQMSIDEIAAQLEAVGLKLSKEQPSDGYALFHNEWTEVDNCTNQGQIHSHPTEIKLKPNGNLNKS